ncbi:hypothetical protein D3C85_639880 [compost metagenome]
MVADPQGKADDDATAGGGGRGEAAQIEHQRVAGAAGDADHATGIGIAGADFPLSDIAANRPGNAGDIEQW